LIESGLLASGYQRPAGLGGPGAGRPAKWYNRAGEEFALSVPPRDDELLALLLGAAVDTTPTARCGLRSVRPPMPPDDRWGSGPTR
jgi:hypothetical protein